LSANSSRTAKKNTRSLRAAGRKELKEIIKTCDAISDRKFNPFFMDVKLGVETLRQYFPYWEQFEDHCLDAHTINKLAEVVRLQNTQLKFQSSALYADPDFVGKKVERMSEKRLAEVFLASWHPLTELEQLTEQAVAEGILYWNLLAPFDERKQKRGMGPETRPGNINSETMKSMGLHGEDFGRQILELWNELSQTYAAEGTPVDYWKFVDRPTYQERVNRAYMVSFLITYGYAKLHVENAHLELTPVEQPSGKPVEGGTSFPIPIPTVGRN